MKEILKKNLVIVNCLNKFVNGQSFNLLIESIQLISLIYVTKYIFLVCESITYIMIGCYPFQISFIKKIYFSK